MEQGNYNQLRQSKVQLSTRLKLKNIFSGEWESIYKGDGIEFADIQPYEPGDDLRDLDLITLLESGEEEIIRRTVGRRMNIFVWVDMSGSMNRTKDMFFSGKPDIRDIAVGLIVYSANNVYSPVGLCAFDKDILCFLPAKYGEDSCDKIMDKVRVLDCEGTPVPADIPGALSYMMGNVNKQSMVFLVSDFKDHIFEENFTDLLRPVAKKFDFIPVVIRDPIEKNACMKRSINVVVKDSKGNGRAEIYLSPKKLKEVQDVSARHLSHLAYNFHEAGIEHVVLDSPSVNDCYQVFSSFFESRRRTKG
jgi:uncharacterized protein (DUF58 family)